MLNEVYLQGFLAALAAGLVTGVGGFCIFFKKHYLKPCNTAVLEMITIYLNFSPGRLIHL